MYISETESIIRSSTAFFNSLRRLAALPGEAPALHLLEVDAVGRIAGPLAVHLEDVLLPLPRRWRRRGLSFVIVPIVPTNYR